MENIPTRDSVTSVGERDGGVGDGPACTVLWAVLRAVCLGSV